MEYESCLLSFEEDEWNKRWNALFHSNKIWLAIGKFHLLTLIIRCYERLIWNCGVVSLEMMDRVTKDTFASAVRKDVRLKEYSFLQRSGTGSRRMESGTEFRTTQSSSSSIDSGREIEVRSRFELGKQMFSTCVYANAIAFFADLTVQQCILLYGYYTFFISKQRERKLRLLKKRYRQYEELKLNKEMDSTCNNGGVCVDDSEFDEDSSSHGSHDDEQNDDELKLVQNISNDSGIAPWVEDEKAIIMLSFLRRSVQASFTRAFGLFVSSIGGAIGSMIYPGWGTLFGIQIGDAAVGALLEDDN